MGIADRVKAKMMASQASKPAPTARSDAPRRIIKAATAFDQTAHGSILEWLIRDFPMKQRGERNKMSGEVAKALIKRGCTQDDAILIGTAYFKHFERICPPDERNWLKKLIKQYTKIREKYPAMFGSKKFAKANKKGIYRPRLAGEDAKDYKGIEQILCERGIVLPREELKSFAVSLGQAYKAKRGKYPPLIRDPKRPKFAINAYKIPDDLPIIDAAWDAWGSVEEDLTSPAPAPQPGNGARHG